MNINSTRNALLRARNLRNAKRSRSRRVMSSRTNTTNRGSNTNSIKRPSSIGSSSQSKQISLYEKIEKAASDIQNTTKNMIVIGNMTYSDERQARQPKKRAGKVLFLISRNLCQTSIRLLMVLMILQVQQIWRRRKHWTILYQRMQTSSKRLELRSQRVGSFPLMKRL